MGCEEQPANNTQTKSAQNLLEMSDSPIKSVGKTVSCVKPLEHTNTDRENEVQSNAPQALEKLEMMVAVMDVEAKKTEAETFRRAEESQNNDVSNMTISESLPTDSSVELENSTHNIYSPSTIDVDENLNRSEANAKWHASEEHNEKEKISQSVSVNESTSLEMPAVIITAETTKQELTAQKHESKDDAPSYGMVNSVKSEVKNHELNENLWMKRSPQNDDGDQKISVEKKRVKNSFDRKLGKTSRSRTSKSKKSKLTDEAIVQSLKELPPLQLCEPEFLMPSLIIQPSLNGLTRGQTQFCGSFGRSSIAGIDDYYANRRFPDMKVCLSNPPTPPTSLPPSPTVLQNALTKEQCLYDMLAKRTHHNTSMFPTPPYGDFVGSDLKNISSKEKSVEHLHRSRVGTHDETSRVMDLRVQNEKYPAFVIDKGLSIRSKSNNSIIKDCNSRICDDINVTLTISAISEKTVHETVNAISELINVDAPKRLTVQHPSRAVYLETKQFIDTSRLQENKSGNELNNSERKTKNAECETEGPYCRHCDVVILGIGVVKNNTDDINPSDYNNVNIEDNLSQEKDIFCSSACLKQYYSIDNSTESTPNKELLLSAATTPSIPNGTAKTKGIATSVELVNEYDERMEESRNAVAKRPSHTSDGKYHEKSQEDHEVCSSYISRLCHDEVILCIKVSTFTH